MMAGLEPGGPDVSEATLREAGELMPEDDIERIGAAAFGRLFGSHDTPARIGRYVVVKHLGSGGMGVVYAAYDPDLDRKIAIKLLRSDSAASESQGRLLREAQALARVRHPNVVHVYETGTHQGRVYLAMEFVEGVSLRAWLREQTRTTAAILAMFSEAGKGLAAAHAAGLTHRDFKPENVLVGPDGRPQVVDFGLAVAIGTPAPSESLAAARMFESGPSDVRADTTLTATGSVVGTPAYMAPEQMVGEEPTPQTDQFAFCVALWEALYGARPFPAGDPDARLDAIQSRSFISDRTRGPRRLRAVLERGLRPTPSDRHPTMEALLQALPRRRSRGAVVGFGFAAIAAVALAGGLAADRSSPCEQALERLDATWSPARVSTIRAHFQASGLGYADRAWNSLHDELDRYARDWRTAYATTCSESPSGQPNARLLEHRACLEWGFSDYETLMEMLEGADAGMIAASASLLDDMRSPEDCTIGAEQPSPIPILDDHELRLDVARAKILVRAGKYNDAQPLARAVVDRARERGLSSFLPEALLLLAQTYNGLHDASGEAVYREAIEAALHQRDDLAAASAWIGLVVSIGQVQGDYERATGLIDTAQYAIARANHDRNSQATLLGNWGLLELRHGNFVRARDKLEQSLKLFREAGRATHPSVVTTLNTLAGTAISLKDYDAASSYLENARAVAAAGIGLEHPLAATTLFTLGNVHYERGEWSAARVEYEKALSIWTDVYGPNHPNVATAHQNLGLVDLRERKLEVARPKLERALAIRESVLGSRHVSVAESIRTLGDWFAATGDRVAARDCYRRSLALYDDLLPAEHPDRTDALEQLQRVERELSSAARPSAQSE